MSYELRPIAEDEIPAFRRSVSLGFGHDPNPAGHERFLKLLPLERTVAVLDEGAIVGTLGDFPMQLTIPGGAQLAMAGTTMVTVRATHTRRGILRSMVSRHLDNAVERGEVIAGLWASESGIYERFGFGLAIECHDTKIDSRSLVVPTASSDISIEMIPASELPEVVAPFWSDVATTRVGFLERTPERWQDIMDDHEHMREGASQSRHIVARRSGAVVGYLQYRQNEKWNAMLADGTIAISTMFAADNDAHLALWRYALDVDLFPNVLFWNGAADDPLAYQVNNARAVQRTVCDGLYVRILDVGEALQARSYEQDGTVTFAVDDDMGYAGGTYTLAVADGTGVVRVADGTDVDVTMSIRDLGALFLGRHCSDVYATTGRITGDPAKVRLLGHLFATARAPWCPEMF